MAKPRTTNLPDLRGLLEPVDDFMRDIQRVLLRRGSRDAPSLSLAEQIAARLAGLIALDRIGPGQRLLEEEVCTVLDVSRAPVREAMRILERDRLLVVVPRRGARVTGHSESELRDVFEVRASLLGTLLAAVMRERPQDLERVLAAGVAQLEEAHRAGSRDGYALVSFQMMVQCCLLSGNRLLAEMVQSLALQTLRYSRLGFGRPDGLSRSLQDWRGMLRAVRRNDSDAVVEFVRCRVFSSRDAALEALGADDAKGAAGQGSDTGRAGTRSAGRRSVVQMKPGIQ